MYWFMVLPLISFAIKTLDFTAYSLVRFENNLKILLLNYDNVSVWDKSFVGRLIGESFGDATVPGLHQKVLEYTQSVIERHSVRLDLTGAANAFIASNVDLTEKVNADWMEFCYSCVLAKSEESPIKLARLMVANDDRHSLGIFDALRQKFLTIYARAPESRWQMLEPLVEFFTSRFYEGSHDQLFALALPLLKEYAKDMQEVSPANEMYAFVKFVAGYTETLPESAFFSPMLLSKFFATAEPKLSELHWNILLKSIKEEHSNQKSSSYLRYTVDFLQAKGVDTLKLTEIVKLFQTIPPTFETLLALGSLKAVYPLANTLYSDGLMKLVTTARRKKKNYDFLLVEAVYRSLHEEDLQMIQTYVDFLALLSEVAENDVPGMESREEVKQWIDSILITLDVTYKDIMELHASRLKEKWEVIDIGLAAETYLDSGWPASDMDSLLNLMVLRLDANLVPLVLEINHKSNNFETYFSHLNDFELSDEAAVVEVMRKLQKLAIKVWDHSITEREYYSALFRLDILLPPHGLQPSGFVSPLKFFQKCSLIGIEFTGQLTKADLN